MAAVRSAQLLIAAACLIASIAPSALAQDTVQTATRTGSGDDKGAHGIGCMWAGCMCTWDVLWDKLTRSLFAFLPSTCAHMITFHANVAS
jgi:hypothetical protein